MTEMSTSGRPHPHTLRPGQVALVICDLQEAFRTVTIDFDEVVSRITMLVAGMKLLNVPIQVTEQYPQRLGRIVQPILEQLPPDVKIVEKTAFSCCGAPAFIEQLQATKATQILLAGLESHVCMNQTVHDLIASGYQVHLLLDCVTSRTELNRKIGIDKMRLAGAIPCSVEMALYELMVDSKHERFKDVLKLVK